MENALKDLILTSAKRKGLTRDDINEETDLIDGLELDSISFVKLIVDIENLFHVEFDDNMLDYEVLTSYGKLYAYVMELVQAGGTV